MTATQIWLYYLNGCFPFTVEIENVGAETSFASVSHLNVSNFSDHVFVALVKARSFFLYLDFCSLAWSISLSHKRIFLDDLVFLIKIHSSVIVKLELSSLHSFTTRWLLHYWRFSHYVASFPIKDLLHIWTEQDSDLFLLLVEFARIRSNVGDFSRSPIRQLSISNDESKQRCYLLVSPHQSTKNINLQTSRTVSALI